MAKQSEIKKTPPAKTKQWILDDDLLQVICEAWDNYKGPVEVIESALGALLIGRLAGYNALRITHSWRTLRKYEDILNIKFADVLPDETPESDRVNGIRYAKKFKAFWKAIAAGVSTQEGAKNVRAATQ
jgi:hypothetical protein